ncbi:MAG: NADP-dependent malic enzyme [Bacteriovorax sp.]|nr:NADP-dependent malic enzyme [Bacteriovorax sp.]
MTSNDLTKAYSPGVAWPCLEIAKDPELAYKYTAKGNLVAVISNGTAVLGLGNIGALAGKPVMEGKGLLFKRFADIDVFDIEVNENTVEGMVKIVSALEPTFGGVNLEDIKAPECFEIETQLIEKMQIPVFHDDQHGTAIIATAAFLNAIEITGRDIKKIKVVVSGAGAAAISVSKLFFELGLPRANLLMVDSNGVIHKGRTTGMNKYKEDFAVETKARTLAEAMNGCDCFVGLSARGLVNADMVKSMAKDPIIFAMANPVPEIYPSEVHAVRNDAIMATGRSDFPNQVNNVLGFPFIFRGALDVRAKKINMEMKLAAVKALAELAKEEVPEEVKMAYGGEDFKFGVNYLIPKPFDPRVLTRVTPAVAKAAMDSGVARINIDDLHAYARSLEGRMGNTAHFMKSLRDRLSTYVAKSGKKVKVVFAEGTNTRILQAVKQLIEEDKIEPILLGRKKAIHKKMDMLGLEQYKDDVRTINPRRHEEFENYVRMYSKERQRNGVSVYHAEELMSHQNYFGSMMVKHGLADAVIAGPTLNYADCFPPLMHVLGTVDRKSAAGIFIMSFKNRVLFFSDCAVQIDPTEDQLCETAAATAELFRKLMKREPRIAFLSFSNFGSNDDVKAKKIRNAVKLTKTRYPNLLVDGEMQADVAVNKGLMDKLFSFATLDGPSDILIFPDLNSANISYKLLAQLGNANAIGPILLPMNAPANIIPRTATVTEIVNMSVLSALLTDKKMSLKE